MKSDLVSLIKTAYEEEQLSAEDIAAGYGLELDLVTTILAGCSAYRLEEASKGNNDPYEVISRETFKKVAKAYTDLYFDEDKVPPATRARMGEWLMDEAKGRNDSKSNEEDRGAESEGARKAHTLEDS